MVREVVEGSIWCVEGSLRQPGGVIFPLRTTIIRLPDGRLWVHSPLDLSAEDVAAIDALGEVGWIVAPSLLHHLFVGRAQAAWPRAQTLGAPGLAAKRPDLRFDGELDPQALPEPWRAALAAVRVDGMPKMNEVIFLHRPTGTLLVTDMVFNIRRPANAMTSLVLWMVGVRGRLAQSRAARFVFTADRAAAGRSLRRVLAWDFDRLIPCHGDIVDTDAHQGFELACPWMLGGAAAALAPATGEPAVR